MKQTNQTQVKIFTPIESQNPLFLGNTDTIFEDVIKEHNGKTAAEIKEDGYRMQVHKKGTEIRAYTRNMNAYVLDLFPELHKSLMALPDSTIIDAELIGRGKVGKAAYKAAQKRFRAKIKQENIEEYLTSGLTTDFPLELKVFDTLCWQGKSLLGMPLSERRKVTESIDEKVITPSTQRIITNSDDLKNWFESLTGDNYEGLVCKNPTSAYLAGQRTTDWIKIKRAETLDLVILGVYNEKDAISQILVGIYNPKESRYESLAKVNAKREGFNKEIKKAIEKNYTKTLPSQIYLNPSIPQKQMPDYFVQPKNSMIVEVSAMNFFYSKNWHSAGLQDGKSYSLRIGWLKGIRQDKNVQQASTVELVKNLYEAEQQGG
jgi:DNA ligase-1